MAGWTRFLLGWSIARRKEKGFPDDIWIYHKCVDWSDILVWKFEKEYNNRYARESKKCG